MSEQDLIYRLRKREEIRRQITTRKSVQEGALETFNLQNQLDSLLEVLGNQ